MFGFGIPLSDVVGCEKCSKERDEDGGKCVTCGSSAELRKSLYVEKAIGYISQYRSSCMQGDRDIAWLALQKANIFMQRLNKLETNFQINSLFREEK